MPRWVLVALAGLAALSGGCTAAPQSGLTVEYHPGQKPETLRAPYDATYELFVLDDAGPGADLIDRTSIQKDHHVGFVRQPDGALVGYAGGRKIPLPEGHFRWQITANTRREQGLVDQEKLGNILGPVVDATARGCFVLVKIVTLAAYGLAAAGSSRPSPR